MRIGIDWIEPGAGSLLSDVLRRPPLLADRPIGRPAYGGGHSAQLKKGAKRGIHSHAPTALVQDEAAAM